MDVDMSASLPPELLVEIFRRLEAAAALHCTGVCKLWRRTIIRNAASCLRPRPDCFVPGLLLGFLQNHRDRGRRRVLLQPLPGPSESAPAMAAVSSTACSPAASSFAQGAATTDLASYDELLSSRDGLVLGWTATQDLCLCSLMTGDRKFIPAGAFKACTYVLLTGYDLIASSDCSGGDEDDDLRALILAVKEKDIGGGMTYQIFSTSNGGAWGAVTVTRSHRFKKGPVTGIYPGSEVICRGNAVHWLARAADAGVVECVVAVDVRSGRTWAHG
jgi:hypothetical protein